MADIELIDLHKDYDGTPAVRGINLSVAHNELIVLVGPSGCGKSTTLRMIAGLESISSGRILIGGDVVNNVEPKKRDIAMVFQNYALYPHMTVYQNMAFSLRMQRVDKADIRRRVHDAAAILNITELLTRYPRQLSGGQRQRVAMGRAIVRNPKVFLFDEPLSNLDAKLRVQMRNEIKRLHDNVGTTMCYVTHDQVEAMTLADRIVVMNGGLIEQVGTPQELYDQPQTKFVAGFIGSPAMNFIEGKVESTERGPAIKLGPDLLFGLPPAISGKVGAKEGRTVLLGLRPEHITERRAHTGEYQRDFKATIEIAEPMGIDTVVFFRWGATEISGRANPRSVSPVGAPMELTVDMAGMNLFDVETGRAL